MSAEKIYVYVVCEYVDYEGCDILYAYSNEIAAKRKVLELDAEDPRHYHYGYERHEVMHD